MTDKLSFAKAMEDKRVRRITEVVVALGVPLVLIALLPPTLLVLVYKTDIATSVVGSREDLFAIWAAIAAMFLVNRALLRVYPEQRGAIELFNRVFIWVTFGVFVLLFFVNTAP